ncbi:hypothetical protein C0J08_15160 [Marinomonas sp. CT5]|nr:hypothetical protein C0J08_15160 [Marinomonas sp. CT5]
MRTAKIKKGTVVVTRVDTLIVDFHKADYCRFTKNLNASARLILNDYNRCFICDWPFQIGTDETGEVMNLVCFKGQVNKLLCTDCYKKLIGGL